MTLIICLDERGGWQFNHRRQSRDRAVLQDIAHHLTGTLYITPFSEKLCAEHGVPVTVSETPFAAASADDTVLLEDGDPTVPDGVDTLIVYRWQRVYPADVLFPIPAFQQEAVSEFPGYSHDSIVKEVYVR